MKSILSIALSLLLTANYSAQASVNPVEDQPQKKVDYQLAFSKIVVEDDIELQLTQSCSRTMEFAGNETDFKKVNWTIKNGVLHLSSNNGSLKNKIRLNISVNQLDELVIKGASIVRSLGELVSPELTIEMDGDCFVSLRNKGNIKVVKVEGTDLDVMKTSGKVKIDQ